MPDNFKAKECERIRVYLNNKYQTDEEFRNKKILYQRQYRLKKRIEKININ